MKRTSYRAGASQAFTLIELVVAIAVIALLSVIALPSLTALFAAGAEEQTHNIISAQLVAARSVAIHDRTYAGVHFQLADHKFPANSALKHVSFTAVVWDDPNTPEYAFSLAPGFLVQRMPGSIVAGKIDAAFVGGGGRYTGFGGQTEPEGDEIDPDVLEFTTFSVVFSQNGSAVQFVEGGPVLFDANSALFTGEQRLWDPELANGRQAQTALTLMNITDFLLLDADKRIAYLDKNGLFLPVGRHTGHLLAEK